MGPVAGDAVNPSMGAWPRHPCRGHPRNRPHPAFDRFLPLLVGADLSRHGVGSRCHATGSDPDLRSIGSEPFPVGKRIRPRASQAPVATGRLLSLTQRSTNWWVPTLVGTGSDPVATQRALTPDLRSMRSEPFSVGKQIRPRASQAPVATGRLLSLTQPLHELVGADLGRHGVGSRCHATGSDPRFTLDGVRAVFRWKTDPTPRFSGAGRHRAAAVAHPTLHELVGADLGRHGVGSRCHATGSDPDLRSIGSEPFSVGKRIGPRASQAPVATGRLLSLTQPLQESA